jgi:hypothetical protein
MKSEWVLPQSEALQGAKLRGADYKGLTQMSKNNGVLTSLEAEINDIANFHRYVSNLNQATAIFCVPQGSRWSTRRQKSRLRRGRR